MTDRITTDLETIAKDGNVRHEMLVNKMKVYAGSSPEIRHVTNNTVLNFLSAMTKSNPAQMRHYFGVYESFCKGDGFYETRH